MLRLRAESTHMSDGKIRVRQETRAVNYLCMLFGWHTHGTEDPVEHVTNPRPWKKR